MSSVDVAVGFIERCTVCTGILPAEGPRVCPACDKAKLTPRESEWPLHLKGYLMMKSVERQFISGVPKQRVWEGLLTGVVAGQMYKGQLRKWSLSSDEVYLALLTDADAWLAAGKPITYL